MSAAGGKDGDERSFAELAAAGEVPFAPPAMKAPASARPSPERSEMVLEPDHPACASGATAWFVPTMSMKRRKALKKGGYAYSFDLHGLNVASAWKRVNAELGACLARGITEVLVIHGAGTGRLRAKVRGWLERSPKVLGYVQHPDNPHSVVVLLRRV